MITDTKVEEWKSQLEQADEYGLFFDRHTVREMIEVIDQRQAQMAKNIVLQGMDIMKD